MIKNVCLGLCLMLTIPALLFGAGSREINEESHLNMISVTHDLGTTQLIPDPERIVVFDFGVLDALDYAGVDVVGIGQGGVIPEYLSSYGQAPYTRAGSLHEPDFETVYDLEPDLIIIGTRAADAYDELSRIAPTVLLSMPMGNYMDTFTQNMEVLAEIFPSRGSSFTDVIQDIAAKTAQLNNSIADAEYSALAMITNSGRISVFGQGSRFAVLYNDLGFVLSDPTIQESTHGQSASFEYLAEQDPEFLFVVDRGAATGADESGAAKALLDNPLVNRTIAARQDRIVYLDAIAWYITSGGIQATRTMLSEIEEAITR